jgi:hypothetical protein
MVNEWEFHVGWLDDDEVQDIVRTVHMDYKQRVAEVLDVDIYKPQIDDLRIDSRNNQDVYGEADGRDIISTPDNELIDVTDKPVNAIPFQVYKSRADEFAAQYGITITHDVQDALDGGIKEAKPVPTELLESQTTKRTLVNLMDFLAAQPASLPKKIGWRKVVLVNGMDVAGAAAGGTGAMFLNAHLEQGSHLFAHEEGHLIGEATVPGGNDFVDPVFDALNGPIGYGSDKHPADATREGALTIANEQHYKEIEIARADRTGKALKALNNKSFPPDDAFKNVAFTADPSSSVEDRAEMAIPVLSDTASSYALFEAVDGRSPRLQAKTLYLLGRWTMYLPNEMRYMLLARYPAEANIGDNPILREALGADWRTVPERPAARLAAVSCGPEPTYIADK